MRFSRRNPALFLPVLAATVAVSLLQAGAARAAAAPGGVDMLPILGALVVILIGAKVGGSLFERFGLPAVLGELAVGILIGNLGLANVHVLDALKTQPALEVLAQIGVLFLLFEVGLHTEIGQMMAVGASSLLVAVLGVVTPMALGFLCSRLAFPAHDPLTHWFVGATLAATSVGITARVLKDLGRTESKEGRIILGAAVIDDVLGLIVLAVVAGVIQAADAGRVFDARTVLVILGKSLGFLLAAVFVGRWLSRRMFGLATRLKGEGLLLPLALAFCFLLAWVAGMVGLAPIVGAFAAGMVLEPVHYRELRDRERHDIPELLAPLASFLVPVFFVLMGMGVDLSVFGNVAVLGFAAVLTAAAIAGKQACSLGVLDKGTDRLAVGLGMIPRGEVGLIFASIGATLHIHGERVVDDSVYSAVVIMVAITTMVTPPLLVWRLRRLSGPPAAGRIPDSRPH